MPAQLRIDIVSDVVCPWCAIGYAQLARAAAAIADRAEVSVRWHPFELAPDTPPQGKLLSEYTQERYSATPEQSHASRARIIEAGRAVGIDFAYSAESRIYNSFDAHRLLAWAGDGGGQTALKLALFRAYFTGQRNIAAHDVLLDAVGEAGLDPVAAKAVLASDDYAQQVRDEEAIWIDRNVTGVPAFIVNGKFMIPGAQDADTLIRVFDRVLDRENAPA